MMGIFNFVMKKGDKIEVKEMVGLIEDGINGMKFGGAGRLTDANVGIVYECLKKGWRKGRKEKRKSNAY
jgi:hypothetical protein